MNWRRKVSRNKRNKKNSIERGHQRIARCVISQFLKIGVLYLSLFCLIQFIMHSVRHNLCFTHCMYFISPYHNRRWQKTGHEMVAVFSAAKDKPFMIGSYLNLKISVERPLITSWPISMHKRSHESFVSALSKCNQMTIMLSFNALNLVFSFNPFLNDCFEFIINIIPFVIHEGHHIPVRYITPSMEFSPKLL